jgi:germination protein M
MVKMNRIKETLIYLVLLAVLVASFSFYGCTPKVDVSIYFARYSDNQAYLDPEIRKISKDTNFYKSVIEELIKGPVNKELYPTIPSDTKVNFVTIKNTVATVDFTKEIITNAEQIPHSSTTEILAIYSIVNTLTNFEEIKEVKITVEGKDSGQIDGLLIEDFWGHIGIYETFGRDEETIGKNIIQQ